MIRTQISLRKVEYDMAKREAAQLGISIAEFFRRALQKVLPVRGKKPWMHYCGLVASGHPQSSQHIDTVIYGQKN